MNVYPVNAIEAAILISPQKAPYNLIEELYNRYISFQVDFLSNTVNLTGTWDNLIELDTIIIGNTNANSGKIQLYNNDTLLYDNTFNINDYITIEYTGIKNANRFALDLFGSDNISAGYLFAGMKWELPRFIVEPVNGLSLRNEAGRTFSGQVKGIPIDALKTFSATYVRIPNDKKEIFNNYINGVQKVIPHVIDVYPEAHEQFEPFFATVDNYGEATKRAENGFFWNFNCSWMEAK
jgi:hypothetical protein